MSDDQTIFTRSRSTESPSPTRPAGPVLRAEDYQEGFGEPLTETLQIDNWRTGQNLSEEYRRIETEVHEAAARETDYQRTVRLEIHPKLAWAAGAPAHAGCYSVSVQEIANIHRELLFPGGVEACDGTCHVHDTLPLTIFQIGVSLVSYHGDHGTWSQRLFRRDLRMRLGDPIQETLALLERRGQRAGLHQPTLHEQMSQLARRAIMAYAERAILLQKSQAIWRLGHGSIAPLELLTDSGCPDLVLEAVKVIRALIEQHQKFVFVANEGGDRALLTIGQALHPLEYAVVYTLRDALAPMLEDWHCRGAVTVDDRWDGVSLTPEQWVMRFRDEVAPRVVVGVFRATRLSPPQIFYAHEDHVDVAARVALADSVLHDTRGFPQLIDLASQVCRHVYGGGSLQSLAETAYAAHGVPFQYLTPAEVGSR